LYKIYYGRIIELFPSYDGNDNAIMVQDAEEGTEAEKEKILELWRRFRHDPEE
jgi:hypothetical protein